MRALSVLPSSFLYKGSPLSAVYYVCTEVFLVCNHYSIYFCSLHSADHLWTNRIVTDSQWVVENVAGTVDLVIFHCLMGKLILKLLSGLLCRCSE
jgi:hypothetical protein